MAITIKKYMTLAIKLDLSKNASQPPEAQMDITLTDKLSQGWELMTVIPAPGGPADTLLVTFCQRA